MISNISHHLNNLFLHVALNEVQSNAYDKYLHKALT